MSDWALRRSKWAKRDSDARTDWDIDYGRIVHSASFRRLQGKTQILNLGDSDFYRTRLTHSMEVAQIATSLTRQIAKDNHGNPAVAYLPDSAMIQAIGSTHDLGHPPFGHGGEVALNYCMRDFGGFEGNGQTLRILTKLEKFSAEDGADLTRRTLLGTLKYPASYSQVRNQDIRPQLAQGTTAIRLIDRESSKPPKCYLDDQQGVVEWILQPLSEGDRAEFTAFDHRATKDGLAKHSVTRHKSLDCSIMDQADDIAYGVHDLEDALALGLIREKDFREHVPLEVCGAYVDFLTVRYPEEVNKDAYNSFVMTLPPVCPRS